jgi:hypothetical protein
VQGSIYRLALRSSEDVQWLLWLCSAVWLSIHGLSCTLRIAVQMQTRVTVPSCRKLVLRPSGQACQLVVRAKDCSAVTSGGKFSA